MLFAFREVVEARKAEVAAVIEALKGEGRSEGGGEGERGVEVVELA